jgi:hypothetical protein
VASLMFDGWIADFGKRKFQMFVPKLYAFDSFRRIFRARYSLISLCRGTGWQTFVTGF